MGVYVDARCRWPRRGLFKAKPKVEDVFDRIEAVVRANVADPMMRSMMAFARDDRKGVLEVGVHPLAEAVEFSWRDGGIEVGAKTSTLGAGYHSHLVDLLGSMAASEGLKWEWEEGSPETDQRRDFGAVQREMRTWLGATAKSVSELLDDGVKNIMVNMSMAWGIPEGFSGVLTPAGPFDAEWVARAARSGVDEGMEAEFFLWSARGCGGAYWKRLGGAMMWTELPWHAPDSEHERRLCGTVLACFERARQLEPAIDVPEAELAELKLLMESTPEEAIPPAAVGLGYSRRLVTFSVTGGWQIRLPGFYYRSVDEERTAEVFNFGGRVVRCTSFSIRDDQDREIPAADLWRSRLENELPGREIPNPAGSLRRFWVQVSEKNGKGTTDVLGEFVADGTLALVTVSLADPRDEAWAVQVLRSVMHPPGSGEAGQ